METGMIPPNLHYTQPLKGVKPLADGRFKVVTEATPWQGDYAAVNSFGFGGANCHTILKSHTKKKINGGAKTDDLPRLVVVSGRNEESVKVFLDDVSEDREGKGNTFSKLREMFSLKGHPAAYKLFTIVFAGDQTLQGCRVHSFTARHSRGRYPGASVSGIHHSRYEDRGDPR